MTTARTLAGLAFVLAGLAGLAGCGGGDGDGGGAGGDAGGDDRAAGLPTDATTEEFCGAFQDFAASLSSFGEDPDPAEAVRAMQDGADSIRETGVPESAGEEQVEGLEATLDVIDSLADDASLEDIGTLDETLTVEEQEQADAFDDYLDEQCGDL